MSAKLIGYSLLGVSAVVGCWYGYQYYNMSNGGIIVSENIKARLQNGRVVLTIVIHNMTSASATINAAHVDVFLRGYNVLDGKITAVTAIEARSSTNLVLEIEPNWLSIAATLMSEGADLLEDLKNFDLSTLELVGKGKVFITKGNLMIPFEQKLIKDA